MGNPDVFDVVIVGAGTAGGLPVAAYLSKAGASVAIIDERQEGGPGQMSHEIEPNSIITPAGASCQVGTSPLVEDLELEDKYGMKILYGQGPVGIVFPDGKCVQAFWDPVRFHEELSRFSRKDADKVMEISKRVLQNLVEFNGFSCSEPSPEKLERIWEMCGEIWGIAPEDFRDMNLFELLDTTFEDDHVKALFAGGACTNCFGDATSKGLGAFAAIAPRVMAPSTVEGGNHELPHVLLRVMQDHGGVFLRQCPVEEITVENGVATGVRLSNDALYPEKVIHARKAVVSDVGARLTLQLVGEETMKKVDHALTLKMKYWGMSERASSVHFWTIKGLPRWKCLEWDPSFKSSFFGYLLPSDFNDMKRWAIQQKSNDAWGSFGIYGEYCVPAALDRKAMSPEGFNTIRIEEVLPFHGFRRLGKTAEYWDDVKPEMMRKRTEIMERLIPGFRDQLVNEAFLTPLDMWRYNRSWVEGNAVGGNQGPDQWYLGRIPYRMPIKQLYMANGTWPFQLSHCQVGYIAACVVAEDLGIRNQPWWKGRPGEWMLKNRPSHVVKFD